MSDKGQGMSDEVKECINRYKGNIDKIISKYINANDSKDSIISFKKRGRSKKEEEKTNEIVPSIFDIQNESFSFTRYIKNIESKPFRTIGFLEIYIGLCCTTEFEDIYELLNR